MVEKCQTGKRRICSAKTQRGSPQLKKIDKPKTHKTDELSFFFALERNIAPNGRVHWDHNFLFFYFLILDIV